METVKIKSVSSRVIENGEEYDVDPLEERDHYWSRHEAVVSPQGYDTVVLVEIWTNSDGECLDVRTTADHFPVTGEDEHIDVGLPAEGSALSDPIQKLKERAGCVNG